MCGKPRNDVRWMCVIHVGGLARLSCLSVYGSLLLLMIVAYALNPPFLLFLCLRIAFMLVALFVLILDWLSMNRVSLRPGWVTPLIYAYIVASASVGTIVWFFSEHPGISHLALYGVIVSLYAVLHLRFFKVLPRLRFSKPERLLLGSSGFLGLVTLASGAFRVYAVDPETWLWIGGEIPYALWFSMSSVAYAFLGFLSGSALLEALGIRARYEKWFAVLHQPATFLTLFGPIHLGPPLIKPPPCFRYCSSDYLEYAACFLPWGWLSGFSGLCSLSGVTVPLWLALSLAALSMAIYRSLKS